MDEHYVHPTIHTLRVRSVEEEREGWALVIAKTVLPAIIQREGYGPEKSADLAFDYADALIKLSQKRTAILNKTQEKTRNG